MIKEEDLKNYIQPVFGMSPPRLRTYILFAHHPILPSSTQPFLDEPNIRAKVKYPHQSRCKFPLLFQAALSFEILRSFHLLVSHFQSSADLSACDLFQS